MYYVNTPNFITPSPRGNGQDLLDARQLQNWAQEVATFVNNNAIAVSQLINEVAGMKEFIGFATMHDPDLIRKYQDFKAVAAKTGAV